MTAKQKNKLGTVLIAISTVVMLVNIALKNHGITAFKWFGLPLFFLGCWLAFMNSDKNAGSNTDQGSDKNPK